MTALLLDTNAFAIIVSEPHRLTASARTALEDAQRLVVSAVSFYEIGYKVRLGKWPAMAEGVADLDRRARDDGFDLLPFDPATALAAAALDWPHRDPFDRMIAATARREGMALVSQDRAFDTLPVPRIWD